MLVGGVPKTLEISSEEVREALSETVKQVVDSVKGALEQTPPELSADIVDKGIVLAGGGAHRNLRRSLHAGLVGKIHGAT